MNPMASVMMRQFRWNVDDKGNVHGGGIDGQTRRNYMTGMIDHKESAKANLKEGFWDAIGLIPVIGGPINIIRGGVKMISGLVSGRGYEAKEGFKNMLKGALFCIPAIGGTMHIGRMIAAAALTKDVVFDAGIHGIGAIRDSARFGGTQGKNALAMGMMMPGMGMGMGMAMMPGMTPYAHGPMMTGAGSW